MSSGRLSQTTLVGPPSSRPISTQCFNMYVSLSYIVIHCMAVLKVHCMQFPLGRKYPDWVAVIGELGVEIKRPLSIRDRVPSWVVVHTYS